MRPEGSPALSAALPTLAGLPLVYALLRVFEHLGGSPEEPAMVIWETPNAFFFRTALALYTGSLLGLVGGALGQRYPSFPLQAAQLLLPTGCAALVLLALLLP